MHLDVHVPAERLSSFNGLIVSHSVGALHCAEVKSTAQRAVRGKEWLNREALDDFSLLIQRSGLAVIDQNGRQTVLGPGEFGLFDNRFPFVMSLPYDFRHQLVRIPRALLGEWVYSPERICSRSFTGRGLLAEALLNALESLCKMEDECLPDEAAHLDQAVLALFSGAMGSDRPPLHNLQLYHRERIRAIARRGLFDPALCVDSIAALAGLSSSYVYRLFAAEPQTLGDWIWKRRLEAARCELLQTAGCERSITDIAYSVGFKNPAHFSRLFKDTFGCSPRSFRQRARAMARAEPPSHAS